MASDTCPCCGRAFNGKKCKNCLYEVFGEEIGHGLHTHKGEPLVIDAPQRRPVPRKNPLACDKTTRKKGKNRAAWWLILLVLLEPLMDLGGSLISDIADQFDSAFVTSQAAVPEPELSPSAQVVYEDEAFTVYADWEMGRSDGRVPLVLDNRSDMDVTLYEGCIVVDGYVTEESYLYCEAPKGRKAGGSLNLDLQELAMAGILEPQGIWFTLDLVETDSYDSVLSAPVTVTLGKEGSRSQPSLDGTLAAETEGLQVWFLGYSPDEYDPERFQEGTLLFLVENTTDRELGIYSVQSQLNGQEADLALWCSLPPDTWSITTVYLYGTEDLGIETIGDLKTLGMSLEVFDPAAEAVTVLEPFTLEVG